jgi:preprotein translocase subunit SecD
MSSHVSRLAAAGLLAALVAAASPGAQEQEEPQAEIRLAESRGGKKGAASDPKILQAVLEKRLSILASENVKIEVRSGDEIVVRLPADTVDERRLKMFSRPGRLTLRHLDDIRTNLNPGGRYLVDHLVLPDRTETRFQDVRTGKVIPAPEFVRGCPVVLDNDDILLEGARALGDGVSLVVRVELNKRGTDRLRRFTSKPGRLVAITLDDEIVGMHAVTRKPAKRKKGTRGDEEPGSIDVVGGFATREDAGYLATVFNSGVLTWPLKVVSRRGVADGTPDSSAPGSPK